MNSAKTKAEGIFDTSLVSFVTVAEEGSFSAAARKLLISQPAVSQQITQLENKLGVKLFDRSSYRPRLTPAGRKLFEGSRDLLARAENLVGKLASAQSVLNIGFTGSAQNKELLSFAANFRHAHPDIETIFQKGSFEDGRSRLLSGALDCAFGIESTFTNAPELKVMSLHEYTICLICSHDHPLARQTSVSPRELANEPFVVLGPRYGSLFYRDFMEYLRQDGIDPTIARTVDSFDELVFNVSIGEGVALTSADMVNENEVAVLALSGSYAHSTYVVAWQKKRESDALKLFLAETKKHFDALEMHARPTCLPAS